MSEACETSLPIEVDPVYGCWIWQAALDKDGYAVMLRRGQHPIRAYQAVYEKKVGPVPAGKVLDHVCRRRKCVNPGHMQAIGVRENQKRRAWGYRVRHKLCKLGHDGYMFGRLTPEGGRVCTACDRSI